MDAAPDLDIRSLPPATGHARVLAGFDALAAGEGLVVSSDRAPDSLLQALQAARPQGFDWNPLEWGPGRFRVEIRRRRAAGPHSATELLAADHRRLDAILAEVKRRNAAGGTEDAAGRFGAFACGLDRHIEAEEAVLFPAFEEGTGVREGPTRVMRAEHVEIRRLVAAVADALERGDAGEAAPALGALTGMLLAHNGKEERILYPMTDEALAGGEARAELVRRLQAVRPRAR